jgi:peroxiredoxin (alkyl hydroperoxide reductase subunit C)
MVIGTQPEDITVKAFIPEKYAFEELKISDYRGKWLVVMFYPLDFTWVCPTEMADLASIHPKLQEMNAEAISVSTDTVYSHLAWKDSESLLKNVKFPMVADPLGKLSRQFGVYDENTGFALRGVFIVGPEGFVKSVDINMYDVGRNMNETLRRLKAFQFVDANPGMACPAKWDENKKALNKSLDIVGKVGKHMRKRK